MLEHIEADLLSGALTPGDRLPPERELAADLGVGRSSVREALRVLEVLGLVRTGTGSGPSAGAIIIATPSGGMSALLRLQVAANGFPLDDVVRTRLVLESAVGVELAEAGARRATRARQLLDAMDASKPHPRGVPRARPAVPPRRSPRQSGNVVIAAMMAGLRSAIECYVLAGLARIQDWDATAARLRAEHRGILAAIDSGDAHSIRALIHDHITGYYARAGHSRRW